MVKVLHISEFTKGGIETHLNEVLKYQSVNHDIYLMVSEQNSNRHSLQISPDRLHLYPYKRSPKYFLKAMQSIHMKMKEINPDIVHVHGTFAGFFLRTLFFFKRKRPVVIYCSHGWAFLMDTQSWKKKIFAGVERLLSLRTDFIINISKHEYQMSMNYGLPSKKSVVVYNGVSDAPPSNEFPFDVPKDRINLLYVGRFDRQKGFDLLLEVFNENPFADVNLYLVGDTVLKDFEYTYPSNAVKIGWVDNSEIDRYMKACDAVIVPSRWEGFGIVAIEALRNKKPVIASNRGALPEIIQHEVNGYIFDFDNKVELVNIIQGLSKDKLEWMGEIGEKIFYEKFHSDKMNQQIVRLYEDGLKKQGGRYSITIKKYV
ncbi:glycosyltransferase [Paenibacillus macquariensis]|uniref:Glycosyltransferase involved in cell wall bisynthesis n=1 Tax=Paenibacillus macquariensis TaxID=948756 RepID=A0ABY1JW12_9BACL|nr:glycosyltransferase [Paenibacillus macquariensis]MEC0090686.1 glycosyltransferase [Paenibacillus macquariensis]OAB34438.1 glycosyl transferase [Paenibacillus macquariensis subsp. macquariensis]SIQ86224.1 Glycosyltransferase involved in cell wall bisynthesis [Paenibacillus macquariensis]